MANRRVFVTAKYVDSDQDENEEKINNNVPKKTAGNSAVLYIILFYIYIYKTVCFEIHNILNGCDLLKV